MIAHAALAFGQHEPERINPRRPAKKAATTSGPEAPPPSSTTSNTARQSERTTSRGKDDGCAIIRGNDAGLRSQPHLFRACLHPKGIRRDEDMPIARVMVHGEKAAAYMADGYARA